MSYQQTIEEIARHVRSRLQECEESTSFIFSISVTGRTHSGEMNVEVSVDETCKSHVHVSGGNLDAVLDEHLRRLGWQKAHAPLCLPNVKTIETKPEINDEIPF